MTLVIGAIMAGTGFLQYAGVIQTNRYWKTQTWTWEDVCMIAVIYGLVAFAAWLSNRELEKSLARARRSEHDLKKERDLLEERVRERTDEVHRLELERLTKTYRLVEFGRFASGIFHDLISPLTALSLTVTHIDESSSDVRSEDIDRAKRTIDHMHQRLTIMRTHLQGAGTETTFSIQDTIRSVVEVLTPYAREQNVTLTVFMGQDVLMVGDAVALTQVITNLVSNAIQSYEGLEHVSSEVRVVLAPVSGGITVTVSDEGVGIAPDMLTKIFEPFFTTKASAKGLGIGLSLAKRIIEKEFNGTITVESIVGKGTTFVVYLPVYEP